jgi:hypothetical protein
MTRYTQDVTPAGRWAAETGDDLLAALDLESARRGHAIDA